MAQDASPDPRPRVVLLTGEPGSGKTTLGTLLARELRVPFVARDDVRGGLFCTAGAWAERPVAVPAADEATEAFLQVVEAMLDRGVSCVVELVIRTDRPDDLGRLTAIADGRVVRTECAAATARLAPREQHDRLLRRPAVLDALGHDTVAAHTRASAPRIAEVVRTMRTDLGLPTLVVRTDDGLVPDLDAIVDFAVGGTSARPVPPAPSGDEAVS